MTRQDVDSLLRDWDEVARTARTPSPAPRVGRVQVRANGLTTLPLLVVAVAVVAGIAVFARSAGGPGPGATPGASTAALVSGADSVDDGTLRLTLSADRGTYADGDPIVAAATLEYIGPGAGIDLFTALDQVVFSVAEVGGGRQAGGGARLSCNRHTLMRGEPVSFPWTKNAAYVPGDPAFAFAEWFATTGSTLRLPAGRWRLSATFGGAEGGCGTPTHALTAEVVVRVAPATAASAAPSTEAITPAPSPPYAGPSNVVTCGRIPSLACGRLLGMLAADHASELTAATRIVVDDACSPSADCLRTQSFNAFVVVVPPAGIDESVAYLATGNEGPDEVSAYKDAIPAHLLAQASSPGVAPEPVRLDTGDPPPQAPATPAACMAALIDGTLTVDDRGSLGIRPSAPASGNVVRVQWPWGYTARVEPLGIALKDEVGQTVAYLGARLGVGGGMLTEGAWTACGTQGIESTTN
jgi:hypothetical protein